MAHWVDSARIRGRVRALTGIAVSLSLLVVSVVQISHSHEGEAELAAECSVCQLAKTPGHTPGSHTRGITGPSLLQAPVIAGRRLVPSALQCSPHRSRAPPLSVSL